MEGISVFFSAMVLACIVEAVLEYVLGIWWQPLSGETRQRVIMAVGLVIGVSLCLVYRVDLMAELGFKAGIPGQILTGMLVGRGADYLHNFWKMLKNVGVK